MTQPGVSSFALRRLLLSMGVWCGGREGGWLGGEGRATEAITLVWGAFEVATRHVMPTVPIGSH